MADPLTNARAALARLHTNGRTRETPDPEVLAEARRTFATESLAATITKTLNAYPPLHPEQKARLVALLMGA